MDKKIEGAALLAGGSSEFIEHLYARYLEDPAAVDPDWRAYFQQLETETGELIRGAKGPSWAREDWPRHGPGGYDSALDPGILESPFQKTLDGEDVSRDAIRAATLDSIRALMMIRAYRVRGHLIADLDPLGLQKIPDHPELDPRNYGFREEDFERPIFIDHVLGLEVATMREILDILHRTYCSTIGVEYMHIFEPEEKQWLQERIEGRDKEVHFTKKGKLAILEKIIHAETLEQFLGKKFVGTKRFGLEGGESLIPAMEAIIKTGAHTGIREIVLGMAHRGRLNVLMNVMEKSPQAFFHEFSGGAAYPQDVQGSGDVKYHLGTSADRVFDGNEVHLSLSGNPSHLEAVDPVVLGKVRAKQVQHRDYDRAKVMGVLLHGDAAFAGQGIVAECFALSQVKGHRTGGTIHIIINNQIGFTTSPGYARSSPYPSDTAKMVQAPILHVNGDDPEAVVHACKVATEFRQTFKKDVVVDMFCYRRYGHNEIDEPSFTQPLMYEEIADHPTARQLYEKRLIEEGLIDKGEADRMAEEYWSMLEDAQDAADSYKPNKADWLEGRWSGLKVAKGKIRRGKTAVPEHRLEKVGEALVSVPEDFNLHPKIEKFMKSRRDMIFRDGVLDWATAEALAFGTLIDEDFRVRLVGQDSGRGTFSQRHSVLVDQQDEERFLPLNNLGDGSDFEIVDSALSEVAVLGFEYGYSLAEPDCLTLWEAQFGDFANGAQVIIDNFIAAGEMKWLRMSGLVMLLPHGYEGQGPEHSSARLERFLQLCGEDNMQVANCTTPANYFHILRRQLHRDFRKPLVLMTPKSLLRHKLARSKHEALGPGTSFHRIMWDLAQTIPDLFELKKDKDIQRVVLCTGKVYYDLFEERAERGQSDTQILRIEQLYPFPDGALEEELSRFPNAKIVWCQEEPRNMGAWHFVESRIEDVLHRMKHKAERPLYAGRPDAASPATGILSRHRENQAELIDTALTC